MLSTRPPLKINPLQFIQCVQARGIGAATRIVTTAATAAAVGTELAGRVVNQGVVVIALRSVVASTGQGVVRVVVVIGSPAAL